MKADDLSFSQRHGYSHLPGRLRLGEISKKVRTAIWNAFCKTLLPLRVDHLGRPLPGLTIVCDLHTELFHQRLDQFQRDTVWVRMETIVFRGRFHQTFDLVEAVLRHPACPRRFAEEMTRVFAQGRMAYGIAWAGKPTIVPLATEASGEVIMGAFASMKREGLDAAIAHLETASSQINKGDSLGAIRESIHAVESVARSLDSRASKAFKPAMDALEKQGRLHPAFKRAMISLYGYTSDEQGIRHALLAGPESDVGIDEAVFMFGVCAVCCGYLSSKAAKSR